MHVVKSLEILNNILHSEPVFLAIGNFDGVHAGHRALIKGLVARSKASGAHPVVMTFSPHPAQFFGRSAGFKKIDTPSIQREYLEQLGIHALLELPFGQDMARMTGEEFIRGLSGGIKLRELTVGSDFRFGKDRACQIDHLRGFASTFGFEIHIQDLTMASEKPVSSSLIRSLIAEAGELGLVARYLGRNFRLQGVVVAGDQVGRKLGFPTANLKITDQIIPRSGVYSGRFRVARPTGGAWGESDWYACVMNIGVRPTVSATSDLRVEAHAYNAGSGLDLYGETLDVEFVGKIRDEMRFSGIEALKQQIANDIATAKKNQLAPLDR